VDADVWIATASDEGIPHLVPLSLAWIDDRIVVATPSDTATARNAAATGRARAVLASTDDVVILDCDAEVLALDGADPSTMERYAARVGWDPRQESGDWAVLVLSIRRAQAWNSPAEIDGRTIVRDGRWLDG
jgi:Pyridoxamine 5'-phosphate oxidase